METKPRNQNEDVSIPSLSGRSRRWPRRLLIVGLITVHLFFFLPLRAFIPLAPDADPWWGLGLVLADEIIFMILIRASLKKWNGIST